MKRLPSPTKYAVIPVLAGVGALAAAFLGGWSVVTNVVDAAADVARWFVDDQSKAIIMALGICGATIAASLALAAHARLRLSASTVEQLEKKIKDHEVDMRVAQAFVYGVCLRDGGKVSAGDNNAFLRNFDFAARTNQMPPLLQ